ncbi:MAG: DUF2784 family protein [Burkholderiales bacterium]|nr:DUF2784 family protein [Burkholderiales bacterium]
MLADLILLLHLAIVLFNTLGLVLVWVGAALGWHWVRIFAFRIAQLLLMGYIALQALVGQICPLTLWEDALRGTTDERGFIARWAAALLYWNAPPWVFAAGYVAWFGLMILTWFLVRPVRPVR